MPGLLVALCLLSVFFLAVEAVSPDRQLGPQATFTLALNAGVAAALSLLPSRRQLPVFLLVVEVFAVGFRLHFDSLAAAVSITLPNLPALVLFRVLVWRYADGGQRLDRACHLGRLLGCALVTAAVSAVGAAGLTGLAAASGLLPNGPPPPWFIFGTRLVAQCSGLVTVMPLVLLLMRRPPQSWHPGRRAELGGWLLLLVAAGVLAHGVSGTVPVGPVALLAGFATLVPAVLRCGSLAAAVLTPAFAVMAAAAIASTGTAAAGPVAIVLYSQVAGFIAALLAWMVSASVAQREAALQWGHARQASADALATLQAALLPPAVTSSPGVQVAARYRVAGAHDQVGGDWYDLIPLPAGDAALVIGDVEGHDLTAASVMALVRGAVRSYALEGHPPSIVLERVNDFLISSGVERLVTMAYVQLYPNAPLATVAVAGHPPPVIVPPSGPAVTLPARPGPLLGVEDLTGWQEQTLCLPPAGRLVLYTDGLDDAVINATTAEGETVTVVPGAAPAWEDGVDTLAEALISRAGTHDDAAVLVVRSEHPDGRRVQRTLPALPISAGIARTWLTDVCALWRASDARAGRRPPDVTDDDHLQVAQLLLTELMSNAIRHTDRWVTVRLHQRQQRLRVGVHDGSDRQPVLREADATAGEGRGLRLVNTLAADWGVQFEPQGKTVWFELDPAASAAVDEDTLIEAFAEPLAPDHGVHKGSGGRRAAGLALDERVGTIQGRPSDREATGELTLDPTRTYQATGRPPGPQEQ